MKAKHLERLQQLEARLRPPTRRSETLWWLAAATLPMDVEARSAMNERAALLQRLDAGDEAATREVEELQRSERWRLPALAGLRLTGAEP